MGVTLLESEIIFVGTVWWFELQIEGALSNLITFEFIFYIQLFPTFFMVQVFQSPML